MRIVLAFSGASGAIYGAETLRALVAHSVEVDLIASPVAEEIFVRELGESIDELAVGIRRHGYMDFAAPPSSGSYPHDGMLIVPCSVATSGRIASGTAPNLICRAADVCLKERRPLILGVRETPLSTFHLRNLTSLSECGAIIAPAAPPFYGKPDSIEELARAYCGRLLDLLGIENDLAHRWAQ